MATTFSLPVIIPGSRPLQRTHAAFLVERVPLQHTLGVMAPRLPTQAGQVAISNAPSDDPGAFFAVDPFVSNVPYRATYPNPHAEACAWLDFVADGVERLVGPGHAHVKLAWPHAYSRTSVEGEENGEVAINMAVCDKSASVVVLVVIPPCVLSGEAIEFHVPPGLKISTHSAHDSHPLFMGAWRAIRDHEFVIAQGSPSEKGIWPRASPFVPALPRDVVPLDPLKAILATEPVPGEPGAYCFVYT
jgi:hypothetical protein